MRKALAILGVATLLVVGLVALPLSAQAGNRTRVRINNSNNAFVISGNVTVANSGGNDQNFNDDRNRMRTGDVRATSNTTTVVNSNVTIVGIGQVDD
jgi:hypothetical protein